MNKFVRAIWDMEKELRQGEIDRRALANQKLHEIREETIAAMRQVMGAASVESLELKALPNETDVWVPHAYATVTIQPGFGAHLFLFYVEPRWGFTWQPDGQVVEGDKLWKYLVALAVSRRDREPIEEAMRGGK